ncbi:uncharacterized protein LOC111344099 [Stylophora pistillata]|uniref:uncharacterized protein LOC111344099 n=1 Tax=Stylophora pistillata TaxID=50429 RepID=UPI000C03EC62|nr:uncharacterized protein LOC111344099 [Stylophora pistillata]
MFNVLFFFTAFLSPASTSNAAVSKGSTLYRGDSWQTVRQHAFLNHAFHYLNVTAIRTFAVYDLLDCTLECLSNLLCFSVNVAASKGADGEILCELLSSDKHKDKAMYAVHRNAHHFSIESSCTSSPCENDGTCVSTYRYDTFDCRCKEGFFGKYCEKVAESCKDVYNRNMTRSSQLVPLIIGSEQISVHCEMGDFGCGDGGWTPVMKIYGEMETFHYNAEYWTDKRGFNQDGGKIGFDSQQTKLPTYWNTPFRKVCLGMRIGQNKRFVVVNKQAESLYSLIAGGNYSSTSLGRDTWKTLIGPNAYLQLNCNKEGFNVMSTDSNHARARIGIIGNNENNCRSTDSWIGFGTEPFHGKTLTCGNYA